MDNLVERLNKTYFDGRLSPTVLGALAGLSQQSAEVQAVVERMCKYMRSSALRRRPTSRTRSPSSSARSSRGWSPAPGVAWSRRSPTPGVTRRLIPILTTPPGGRPPRSRPCSTSAVAFPRRRPSRRRPACRATASWGWTRSFPYYIVYDEQGDYATFDQEGTLEYFQAGIPDAERYRCLAPGCRRHRSALYTVAASVGGLAAGGRCSNAGHRGAGRRPAREVRHRRVRAPEPDVPAGRNWGQRRRRSRRYPLLQCADVLRPRLPSADRGLGRRSSQAGRRAPVWHKLAPLNRKSVHRLPTRGGAHRRERVCLQYREPPVRISLRFPGIPSTTTTTTPVCWRGWSARSGPTIRSGRISTRGSTSYSRSATCLRVTTPVTSASPGRD